MVLSWGRRRAARKAEKKHNLEQISSMEVVIPSHFRCPISLDLMKDPVALSTGITYDRESIEKWIEGGNRTCPMTKQVLNSLEPVPNHTLRMMIQDWCVEKRSYGIERIPTPKIPISSNDVLEILSKIEAAAKDHEDGEGCKKYVSKIKGLVIESERNKRCIVENGSGRVLAAAFEAFSKVPFDQNAAVLEEILSALAMMLPLDGEARNHLGANSSMNCLIWFLKNGSNLSRRRNSVLALIQIVSNDCERIDDLVEIEGAMEAMVKVIKEPISPTTTKATLLLMYHIVSRLSSSASASASASSSSTPNSKIISKLAETGLIQILLEILVDCEKSICEKALGVLDELCSSDEGREKAYENALTMPVLVKKILRISDMATQFSVSILWKLGKDKESEEGREVLVEALELGAFQKLLLLLQFGCSDRTKDKACDVLKWLNLYRDRVECIDTLDFKNLKR